MIVHNSSTALNFSAGHLDNVTTSAADGFGNNGTSGPDQDSVSVACINATETVSTHTQTSPDALLYIVTVLTFYSLSMVILMIKYIRREREEAEMAHYYSEFVTREKFKTPKFELQNYMKLLKYKNDYIYERNKHTNSSNEDCLACVNVPLVSSENKTDEEPEIKDVPTSVDIKH